MHSPRSSGTVARLLVSGRSLKIPDGTKEANIPMAPGGPFDLSARQLAALYTRYAGRENS